MRCFPVLARSSGPFGGSKRTVPLAPERRQGRRLLAPDRVPNVSRSAPMARRMLIDASHPEETRVVVVDGTKLTEFDFETASRKPLKGNIYLAKVIRIEPSLQAAFVEYGGNRHGFLAFSEIHPDYYQIPIADRQRLIDADARAARDDDEAEDNSRGGRRPRGRNRRRERPHTRSDETVKSDPLAADEMGHEAADIPAGESVTGDRPENESPESSASEHGHESHDHEDHHEAAAVGETENPP